MMDGNAVGLIEFAAKRSEPLTPNQMAECKREGKGKNLKRCMVLIMNFSRNVMGKLVGRRVSTQVISFSCSI